MNLFIQVYICWNVFYSLCLMICIGAQEPYKPTMASMTMNLFFNACWLIWAIVVFTRGTI